MARIAIVVIVVRVRMRSVLDTYARRNAGRVGPGPHFESFLRNRLLLGLVDEFLDDVRHVKRFATLHRRILG